MENNINELLDNAHSFLDSIEAYNKKQFSGVFNDTIDSTVINYLDGTDSPDIQSNEWYLYRINELVYSENEGIRRESMENVLATFRGFDDVNIIYMILGSTSEVNFYLGVSTNLYTKVDKNNSISKASLDIKDYADILEPSIRGNFVGSLIEKVGREEKQLILERMKTAEMSGFIDGIPGFIEQSIGEKNDFQGVERLADTMVGTEFGLVVIATPCSSHNVINLQNQINILNDLIEPVGKLNLQNSIMEQSQRSTDNTDGVTRNVSSAKSFDSSKSKSEQKNKSTDRRRAFSTNISASKNESANTQDGQTSSMNMNYSNPKSYSHQKGTENSSTISETVSVDEGTGFQLSQTKTMSHSNQWSDSKNSSKSVSRNKAIIRGEDQRVSKSKNISTQNSYNISSRSSSLSSQSSQTTSTMEVEKRGIINYLKYIDEILLNRVDKGKSKGSYTVSTYLYTQKYRSHLYRLANTVMALYSGEKGSIAPLHFTELSQDNKKSKQIDAIKRMFVNLQNPMSKTDDAIYKCLFSKYVDNKLCPIGSWLTVDELGLLMGMPQREVLGLTVRNEAEYGINLPNKSEEEIKNSIDLGILVHHGEPRENNKVYLEHKHLNKHLFVCGVTGSGKTTTCQSLLVNSHLPFLVIEPAKTEYRVLAEDGGDDIIYFTLGKQNVAPFFLNPFELFKNESITSRADMIKATIISAFDMEAAMPQIIEAATYEVYKQKGWNIRTNKWVNPATGKEDDPFKRDSYAFPQLSDFLNVIDEVTRNQGFGERLEAEYLGSLKARISSLIVGSKGMMLNTPRSVDFSDLVTKKVVIELEEIKDGSEKSLIMGFIITNLLEAIKENHIAYSAENREFRHITLIEEAHRLLSKVDAFDNPNKRRGVEIFADMLAEVRKYGESLIIVDQIPNKMTPEVLKNTSTKIVHKIFAQDDKEAIGNTMALKQEQKEFLSFLDVGRAIMITEGWQKPIQVKISPVSSTTGRPAVNESILKERAFDYYVKCNSTGVIPGLDQYNKPLTPDLIKKYLEYLFTDTLVSDKLRKLLKILVDEYNREKQLPKNLAETMERIGDYIYEIYHYDVEAYNRLKKEFYPFFIGGQLGISSENVKIFLKILDEMYNKKLNMDKNAYAEYIGNWSKCKDLGVKLCSIAKYL